MREFVARAGQQYVQVSPGARYEREIQKLVFENAPALFPEYFACNFEPLFVTPAGNVKPDMVLIRVDGQGWALVEVEIEGHSFSSHILPQLTKLIYAESSSRLAADLIAKMPNVSPETIRSALGYQPTVYLAIHGQSVSHDALLVKLGVEVRDLDVLEAPDKPNEYVLIVRDRTIRRRAISAVARRSNSLMTANIWTIDSSEMHSLAGQDGRIEVEMLGTRAMWGSSTVDDSIMIRQPNGLTSDRMDVNSVNLANVWIDDEHGVLYLEPTRSES